MRSQRVQLAVQPDTVWLRPGEQCVFSIAIENPGRVATVSHLTVRGLPHSWYVLDADCVDLSSGGVIYQTLTLHLPFDAELSPGRYPFRVEITTDAEPRTQVTAIVDLQVGPAVHDTPLIATSGDAIALGDAESPLDTVQRWDASKRRVLRLRWAVAGGILTVLALLLGFFALPHLQRPAPERTRRSIAPVIRPALSPGAGAPSARSVPRHARVAALVRTPRRASPTHRPRRYSYAQSQILFIPSALSIAQRGGRQRATAHLIRLVNRGPRPLTIEHITLATNAHGMFRERDTCADRTLRAHSECTIRLYIQRSPRGRMHTRLIVSDSLASSPQRIPVTVRP